MVFSKEKMIERLKKSGRGAEITADIVAIMDDLDGQEATSSCWDRWVKGEPVLWVIGKSGEGQYVNENDCI